MAFGGGWNPVRISGKSPLPRSGHVAVEYMGKIFVWGGSVGGKDCSTDLNVLNTGLCFLFCFVLFCLFVLGKKRIFLFFLFFFVVCFLFILFLFFSHKS